MCPARQAASSAPNGIRTRAAALKGRCPRPLDDGGLRRSSPPRTRGARRRGPPQHRGRRPSPAKRMAPTDQRDEGEHRAPSVTPSLGSILPIPLRLRQNQQQLASPCGAANSPSLTAPGPAAPAVRAGWWRWRLRTSCCPGLRPGNARRSAGQAFGPAQTLTDRGLGTLIAGAAGAASPDRRAGGAGERL